MSEHAVKVIRIEAVNPHPNADKLDIIPIGGWQAVARKGDFSPGDLAIYIEPDYVVSLDRPEFKFLDKDGKGKLKHRLKAIRLRGALSYGLLIPVGDLKMPLEFHLHRSLIEGDNVMEVLGIERWEPKIHAATTATMLDKSFWPQTYTPTFDLENIQNRKGMIREGEEVVVTEKVDGANARFLYHDGKFHIGSRTRWLKWEEEAIKDEATGERFPKSIWRLAHDRYPEIEAWCRANEGVTLFGEVFGRVQDLKYGRDNEIDFVAFAALKADTWLDWEPAAKSLWEAGVPVVPVICTGPYSETLHALAENDSIVPGAPVGHMREGVVITPRKERRDDKGNRVSLKLISNRFWLADQK